MSSFEEQFENTRCRGRNGYFNALDVFGFVGDDAKLIMLEVTSKRQGDTPPILFEFKSMKDLDTLISVLQLMKENTNEKKRKDNPTD